jgi:APA family basic amino acid/polyamine antiporter
MARDRFLPRALTRLHPRYATPHLLLIAQGVLLSVLTYFWEFVDILVMSVWLSMPTYIIGYALPFILRWKQPDLRGAFRVPGGWISLSLVCLPPVLIAFYVLVMVEWERIEIAAVLVALGPALYLLAQWLNRRFERKPHSGAAQGSE